MEKLPKVAVVILCWNGKSFLEEFLPHLLQTTYPNVEYVVADNASTDDSVAFVKEHYPQITLLEADENTGFAEGYNVALKQVEADIYVLLNQDVEVTPGWIEPVVKMMQGDPTIGAVQPKLRAQLEKEKFEYAGAAGGHLDSFGYAFTKGRVFWDIEDDKGQYDKEAELVWATGACMFVRAKLYHRFGGLDGDFFAHMEEIDLCWRMKNAGYRIMLCPDSTTYHVGGGSLSYGSPMKTYLNFRNNLSLLMKNHLGWSILLIMPVRLALDVVSAYKFLLEGEPKHWWAVARAHFYFFSHLPSLVKKRLKVKRTLKEHHIGKPNRRGFYRGLIIVDKFLRGKKKFSELDKGKFVNRLE